MHHAQAMPSRLVEDKLRIPKEGLEVEALEKGETKTNRDAIKQQPLVEEVYGKACGPFEGVKGGFGRKNLHWGGHLDVGSHHHEQHYYLHHRPNSDH